MFDYSSLHWMAFFPAALLLVVAPGPDFVFIIGQTLRGGRRAGFTAMVGIWLGAFGHVIMATFGLSAVLMASATVFTAVKWVGAGYLVWLGISALKGNGPGLDLGAEKPVPDMSRILRQGALVCLLNPKVAVFFLAFLPQFVEPGAGPEWAQMFLHGVLIIAVAMLFEPFLVLGADRVAAHLRATPSIARWLDRTLGAILVALGLRLALSER